VTRKRRSGGRSDARFDGGAGSQGMESHFTLHLVLAARAAPSWIETSLIALALAILMLV
jgi:hypothetical protein